MLPRPVCERGAAAAQAAPYALEPLAHSFAEETPEVRLALLTAAMKLLFQRPPEARPLLGAALAAGVADTNQDVHDRALLYYRWAGGGGRWLPFSFIALGV
jgi:hypothetical protein